jgi:hypothetical protein
MLNQEPPFRDGASLGTSPNQKALSAALALAHEDPDVGSIQREKRWHSETTKATDPGTDRVLRVRHSEGAEAVVARFMKSEHRPSAFPQSLPFIPGHIVWVGEQGENAGAVWIKPGDPADLASRIVAESVTEGWDLEGGVNWKFPRLIATVMTRDGIRRSVSIIDGSVTLNQQPVKRAAI